MGDYPLVIKHGSGEIVHLCLIVSNCPHLYGISQPDMFD